MPAVTCSTNTLKTLLGGAGVVLPLSKTCLFCISEHFYSRTLPIFCLNSINFFEVAFERLFTITLLKLELVLSLFNVNLNTPTYISEEVD